MTSKGLDTPTDVLVVLLCARASRLRDIVDIVDDEYKTISRNRRKVDKGSKMRRRDSQRHWFEHVRGLKTSGSMQ